jgi:hypothetical protein
VNIALKNNTKELHYSLSAMSVKNNQRHYFVAKTGKMLHKLALHNWAVETEGSNFVITRFGKCKLDWKTEIASDRWHVDWSA